MNALRQDQTVRTRSWILPTAAIILLALNLRAAVSSLGVVLDPVSDGLGLNPAVAGALTTLPVLCFAGFGAFSPQLVRWAGLNRTAFGLLIVVSAGLTARALVDSGAAFVIFTVIALAAAAVGNVILPALAKQHLPDHVSAISALYGAALTGGAALSSGLTVPIAHAVTGGSGDSWRAGLGAWAILAVAAALPWIPMLRHDVHVSVTAPHARIGMRQVAHSPMAWALAASFGVQSSQAYAQFGWFPSILDDAGLSPSSAGAMLGILSAVGIPVSLSLPVLIRWAGDRPILPWLFTFATIGGWLGVLLSPTAAPIVWSVLLGFGGGMFPWCLTMIGRRSATVDGTAALSGFVQGIGYSIAAIGPFSVGLLHGATGGFDVAIYALIGGAVVMGVVGTLVVRGGMLESELAGP